MLPPRRSSSAPAFLVAITTAACSAPSTAIHTTSSEDGTRSAAIAAGAPDAAVDAQAANADPCRTDQDADARKSGAERAESFGTPLDLNGDGVEDLVYRAWCTRDCTYLLYVADTPCPRFVAELEGTVIDRPRCDEPAKAGTLCRISLDRMMIHGDLQEYFYRYVPGTGYVEDGHGRYVPPRERD